MKIKFDSQPIDGDNDKYIKTKIKSCESRINTNFQSKNIPKENASYNYYVRLIMLGSLIKVNKK